MKTTLLALFLVVPALTLAQPVQQPQGRPVTVVNPTPGTPMMDGKGPHGQGRAKVTPRKSSCQAVANCPRRQAAQATTTAK